jgi:hypothetical protein
MALTQKQADKIREEARDSYDLDQNIDVGEDAEVEETAEGYWISCRIFLPK